VLTKWTAPAFFYGTVIPFLWWRGRLRLLWSQQHLVAVSLAATICLTWVLAAGNMAGWDTLIETVKRQALVHLSPQHHHRAYPWQETLVHPFRLWAGCLPVSVFALPAFWPGFAKCWDERGRRLLQALHCWIWPNLIFWSVVPEHAVRQGFPLYPAFAGMGAMVWTAWVTGRRPWRLPKISPAHALVVLVGLWLIVKLAFVHVVVPGRDENRHPRAKGAELAALIPQGETLYLSRLKDEGILFYYGRPALRVPSLERLPSRRGPFFCILDGTEWRHFQNDRSWTKIREMEDEQQAPIFVMRFAPPAPR
jgi:hypothetical protein